MGFIWKWFEEVKMLTHCSSVGCLIDANVIDILIWE